MNAEPPIVRREILEERANRDAFHLALLLIVLLGMLITVIGIAAWNTRIAFIPLAPKAAEAPVRGKVFLSGPLTCRPVPHHGGAGASSPGESNTAVTIPAHAAGLQQFRSL